MKLGGGKIWFTATELAELALPGLPKARNKVNERARIEGWAYRIGMEGEPLARPRKGKGGGVEYHLQVLPPAARSAIAKMGVATVAHVSAEPETRSAALWREFEAMSEKARDEARRRLQIVQLVGRYESMGGLTRSAAVTNTAARSSVAASTLWQWLSFVDGAAPSDWLPLLAPRHAGGGKKAEIDDTIWQALLSDYLRPEQPSFETCFRRAEALAQQLGIKLPHKRTLRRRVDALDKRVLVGRRQGADALRQLLPPNPRTVANLHAMALVNIDGHRWDVFVKWPDGTVARPMMVGIQDVYSRKFLAWSTGKTESAIETRAAFLHLFQRFGIPGACLMDNGRAFASKWISGGATSRFRFKIREDEPLGLLKALGIANHWATPYRGQAKPIERCFRDFCDAIAKHPAFAGAYTGNKPDAKPENYGSKAVPLARFNEIVEAGFAEHNARLGRRSEIANGDSFDQAFADSYAVAPIGKATDEQLRLAMLTADDRATHRQNGSIELHGNRYWNDALVQIAGQRVTVRFDPDDLHAPLHVYATSGEYICAAPVIEASGFLDVDAAKARAKLEANHRKATRAAIEAEQLLDADRVAEIYRRDTAEPDLPEPSVIRPIRRHGNTAAALKTSSQRALNAQREAAQVEAIDLMRAGFAKRLRAVE